MKNKESKKQENMEEQNKNNTDSALNNSESSEVQLDEKDLKIEQLEKDLSDYKDRLLRKAAEFENFKRRTENDQFNLIKYAAESFIVKLLPVVDDFERSLIHIDNSKDIEPFKEGIKLVYEKLIKILEEQGVAKIDAVGKPFDVHFHEALMQRKAEDVQPYTILDELEKGYLYKDKVIRHSKVIVSDESSEETANSQSSDNSSNIEGNNKNG